MAILKNTEFRTRTDEITEITRKGSALSIEANTPLGLSDRHSLHRVTRPRGGIKEWFRWLPVSLHKKSGQYLKANLQNCSYSRFQMEARGNKVVPFSVEKPEADVKQIAMMARDTFEKDGPLLVIASGRDTISVASSIKRLQHPWSWLNRWITPREPPYRHVVRISIVKYSLRRGIDRGKSLVLTMGALHLADSVALRTAASVWHDELAPLAKPLLVVNIGGPTINSYVAECSLELWQRQNIFLKSQEGLLRRFFLGTVLVGIKNLLKEFSTNLKAYIWDGKGPNPHMGHLVWANTFVITADSLSMLTEAYSTG
ncbi:hypothetical protein CRYUN_Cryun08bG0122800 [Craigia yunnanensis]